MALHTRSGAGSYWLQPSCLSYYRTGQAHNTELREAFYKPDDAPVTQLTMSEYYRESCVSTEPLEEKEE